MNSMQLKRIVQATMSLWLPTFVIRDLTLNTLHFTVKYLAQESWRLGLLLVPTSVLPRFRHGLVIPQ